MARPLARVPRPVVWTNQTIKLYHGTLTVHVPSLLAAINPFHGRVDTDFGQGFYTTTKEKQPRDWARQLAVRLGGSPAVICFDVDRKKLAVLDSLWFVRGRSDAEDYWSFVSHARVGGAHGKIPKGDWYDIVVGPVTASWRRRYAIPDSDQIGFHTSTATAVLDRSPKRRLP